MAKLKCLYKFLTWYRSGAHKKGELMQKQANAGHNKIGDQGG